MNLSAVSLALLPLCFAYAIVRYRLMDVDIIFKRGLAYTAATAGVLAVYAAMVALIGALFHTAGPTGLAGEVIAIVVAVLLFHTFRDWTQARLDRFFYRDRLNYRRTLIEFGRTLTSEVRLEPMLASVMDRLSQTLLVDRLAIFLEDSLSVRPVSARSSDGPEAERRQPAEPLDLSFLSPERRGLARGYLFYESPRTAREETECGSAHARTAGFELLHSLPRAGAHHRRSGLGQDGGRRFSHQRGRRAAVHDRGLRRRRARQRAALFLSGAEGAASRATEGLLGKHRRIAECRRFGRGLTGPRGVMEHAGRGVDRRAAARSRQPPACGGSSRRLGSRNRRARERPARCGLYKFLLRNRAGQTLVVNVSVAPLVGKSGERVGRLILLDDITQRTRLEEQLLQTEKLSSLGLLAAGVAHEVNTPLAVISNYIQILAKQLPAEDPRHKLIDKIVKQTFRASEIVNHLLNFSRTGGAEFREVDLNQVIEETLSLVSHPFRTAQVQVVHNLEADLPAVFGSGNRLQQVFLNLFMNARDAMPSGGMLEVRTFATNGSVEVEVADTGSGISRDNLPRIFDPFFTTKSTGRGTGLGLSVSYGIVKEHAGKIEVRSSPGQGTSFRLEFPAARKAVHA